MLVGCGVPGMNLAKGAKGRGSRSGIERQGPRVEVGYGGKMAAFASADSTFNDGVS